MYSETRQQFCGDISTPFQSRCQRVEISPQNCCLVLKARLHDVILRSNGNGFFNRDRFHSQLRRLVGSPLQCYYNRASGHQESFLKKI